MNVAARLEAKSIPEPNSGCLLWTGGVNAYGYGVLGVNQKMVGAHRLSYELSCGPIPDGMHICHKCDVRACINPDHLFLGTQADNLADMRAKARGNIGERHGHVKLTEADVLNIRRDGRFLREIAADYGVDRTTIWAIRRGHTWKHLLEAA